MLNSNSSLQANYSGPLAALLHIKDLYGLENLGRMLVDFHWRVAVGQNIEQVIHRYEVESGESLTLRVQIFIQSFLANL